MDIFGDSRDSATSQDPLSDASTSAIQDELQRLRLENATLNEEVLSLRMEVGQYESFFGKLFRQPPPEILHQIFERTIPPLFLLDPSACLAEDFMWCQVFRQKQTLVSVCKAWYNVALPFLYEHIHVRFIPQLSQLLDTLGTPGTDFKRFVNAITFYCMIPTSYADRFEEKLQLFFSLCPNAKAFSYLSSCPLPSSTCLKVLPAHVTHLNLDRNISCETLMNTLEITAPNLVALSLVSPLPSSDTNAEIDEQIRLPNLETLSCVLRYDRPLSGFDLSKWNLPRMTSLTLQCSHDVGQEDVINPICRKHGAGLKYINISPYWEDEYSFAKVLDLCPALEHIVVHLCTDGPLSHKRVKWVDIWEIDAPRRSRSSRLWKSVSKKFTKAAFPSLQGIRHLSLRLAYLHNLPLIFPPDQVLTPADSYSYNFLEMNIRHDIGRIHGDGHPRPIRKAKGYSFGPPPFFNDDDNGPATGNRNISEDCEDSSTTDDSDSNRGLSENEDNDNPEDKSDSVSVDEAIDTRYRWRWRSDSPSSSEVESVSDSSSLIDWEVRPGQDLVVINDAEMDALE